MRIIFIDHDQGHSGSTISLQFIIDKFKKPENEVRILSAKRKAEIELAFGVPGNSTSFFRYNFLLLALHFSHAIPLNAFGIKVLIIETVKVAFGVLYGFFYFLSTKPSMVYINEYVSVHLAIPAKLLGIPVVVHVRSLLNPGSFGLRKRITEWILDYWVDRVICITEIEKDQFKFRLASKVKVIREFISEPDYQSITEIGELREKFKLPLNRRIVINLCGISSIKGTLVYLKAIESIIANNQDTPLHFILVGPVGLIDNAKKEEIDFYLNRYSSHVEYFGEQTDITALFIASDIVVCSNTQTHFSRPLIEAWHAGKPVIASDTRHNMLDVVDGMNGLLYRAEDSKDLSRKIEALNSDGKLKEALMVNGKKTALEKYDLLHNLDQIYNLCRKLH